MAPDVPHPCPTPIRDISESTVQPVAPASWKVINLCRIYPNVNDAHSWSLPGTSGARLAHSIGLSLEQNTVKGWRDLDCAKASFSRTHGLACCRSLINAVRGKEVWEMPGPCSNDFLDLGLSSKTLQGTCLCHSPSQAKAKPKALQSERQILPQVQEKQPRGMPWLSVGSEWCRGCSGSDQPAKQSVDPHTTIYRAHSFNTRQLVPPWIS